MTGDDDTGARTAPTVTVAALEIVRLSDRGEITLSAVERVISDFMARGMAAQQAVDEILDQEKAGESDNRGR